MKRDRDSQFTYGSYEIAIGDFVTLDRFIGEEIVDELIHTFSGITFLKRTPTDAYYAEARRPSSQDR